MHFKMVDGKVVLTEAGKKVAARNASRLKKAMALVAEVIAEAGDDEDADAVEASQGLAEAILLQSQNVDGKRGRVHMAIRASYREAENPDAYVSYVWIRDFFDDCAVYDYRGKLWQRSYTVDGEAITLGDPVEVEVAYVNKAGDGVLTEAAIAEAYDLTLTEGAVKADGTILAKFITPGWGSSGYYSRDVLERDGPRVFAEGTKMYADHPSASERVDRPERSIKDLVAETVGPARWQDNGPDGPGLYAPAKVFEAWRGPINDMAKTIGLSIRASGRARMGEAEGRKGPIITELVDGQSVDFVTEAGRGGRIVPLAEAARKHSGTAPTGPEKEEPMPLTEAEQALITGLQESNKNLVTVVQRMSEANSLRDARDIATTTLAGVQLPAVTKARLAEALAMAAPVTEAGALDRPAFLKAIAEAAKAEGQYLADAGGLGHIKGLGESLSGLNESETPKVEDSEKALAEAFAVFGLSESAAAIAGKGRV